MIAQSQIIATLRPWLGPYLTESLSSLMGDIAVRLNGYSIRRDMGQLTDDLDSLLFNAVRLATRGTLLIQLEDGGWVRLRLEDFSTMADELMLLVFLDFPVDEAHFQKLRDFSMHRASLSALRALYTHFSFMQTSQELRTIASVARSCYPAFRWREWLGAS